MPTTIIITNTESTIHAVPVGPNFMSATQIHGSGRDVVTTTRLISNADWLRRCELAKAAGCVVE